jgi:trigger factor
MNITRENIDELNVVLKLELGKSDYEERVTKVLKDYKKKAQVPGFRPGNVPIGLINKMYRKPVLVDEINKLVSDSLSDYLVEQKLNILGEPLPHAGENKTIDWDNDSDFEFKFDLGLAPEFDVKLSTKDKVTYYNIKVDNELIDKYVDSYTQRFGEYVHVEDIQEKDMLTVSIAQLNDNGEVAEGGIKNEEARIAVEIIKDKKIKDSVLKAKKGDVLSIDLRKAYPNDTEIASILKVKTEEAKEITGNFQITINEIQRFDKAEINQELFDKVYGEGIVKSVEEFRSKISDEASVNLKRDSDYKFRLDAKEELVKKFKNNLPVEFLKRWLFAINEGKFTLEEIEKDFDHFMEDLKWQLIKDKIAKENEIKVTEEDIKSAARENARLQFSYYGMNNVPDEHLDTFAARTLENKEQTRKLAEGKLEDAIIEFVKQNVKIEEKEITHEKFNKLFEETK